MSNDDRSRRVWRLLERGWTSARVLKDAIQQVRGRVDEARVRLSDEVVSRLAGQPVRTQPTLERTVPVRDGSASETPAPSSARPDPTAQAEIMSAADGVGDEAVVSEAQKSAPPPEPIFVRPPAPTADDMSPDASKNSAPESATSGRPDLPTPMEGPPPGPPASPPGDGRPWSELLQPARRLASAASSIPPPSNGASSPPAPSDPASPSGLPLEDGEIVALARDAEWLFIYWEVEAHALAQSAGVAGDLQFLLRVVQPHGAGRVHESSAAVPSGRRYVRVPFADASYHAELWVAGSGREVLLARSSPAATPPATPRPVGLAAMASSAAHRGVLNAAWDLSQVPRLEPPTPVEAAAEVTPVAVDPDSTTARIEEGSEARLQSGQTERPNPADAAGALTGSEDRLAGDASEGSEGRLGGYDLSGSEGRLAGPTSNGAEGQ